MQQRNQRAWDSTFPVTRPRRTTTATPSTIFQLSVSHTARALRRCLLVNMESLSAPVRGALSVGAAAFGTLIAAPFALVAQPMVVLQTLRHLGLTRTDGHHGSIISYGEFQRQVDRKNRRKRKTGREKEQKGFFFFIYFPSFYFSFFPFSILSLLALDGATVSVRDVGSFVINAYGGRSLFIGWSATLVNWAWGNSYLSPPPFNYDFSPPPPMTKKNHTQ